MNSWSSRASRLIIIYELRHPVWQWKVMCICRSMNDEWTQNSRRRREHCECWVLVCNDKHVIFGIEVSNMKYRGRSTSVLILACGWMSKRLACERNLNRFHYKLHRITHRMTINTKMERFVSFIPTHEWAVPTVGIKSEMKCIELAIINYIVNAASALRKRIRIPQPQLLSHASVSVCVAQSTHIHHRLTDRKIKHE